MVRFKNRYIVAEIIPESAVTKFSEFNIPEPAICNAIRNKVQQLHGDFGFAAITSGLIVKYWNSQLRTVLIRARHGPHKFVASSLPFVDKIGDKKIVLNTLYLGGTMRNCFKFLIKYHKEKAFKELSELKGSPEYDELFKSFTNVKTIDRLIN